MTMMTMTMRAVAAAAANGIWRAAVTSGTTSGGIRGSCCWWVWG